MKDLYFFVAHLDDFEISCLGYLFKNIEKYRKINIIVASTWPPKIKIWDQNLKKISSFFSRDLTYINLEYPQRTLMSYLDDLKDDFYKQIDFSTPFDIVTHDNEDCHTDHLACSLVAGGLFKYTNRYTTIYSPSSKNFKANYWTGLDRNIYELKKECIDQYNIDNEQSYTKLGYYMQNEEHYNIGKAYYLENFVRNDLEYCEAYRVLKDLV